MSSETLDRYADAVMNTFGRPQLVLVKGEGAYVWDEAGRRYLDLLGGIAVNALGHAHPGLVAAVTQQLATLGHVSNIFATHPQIALAERLLQLLGRDGRVFFTNSGAEANEAAFKMTRKTGRRHIVATEGSFHGRTMGALALTSKAAYREPFEPLPGVVTFVPYGDAAALEAAVTADTAAVIVEPIQGEAGVIVPPSDYLRQARRITRATGTLLWLDEIQTGIGRTGRWFAHEAEVEPDIVTLAKGLGGGLPIGAAIGLGAAATLLEPGNHGSTYAGNPVATAAALAVLDEIEKADLLSNAQARGAELVAGLTACEGVARVDGAGLLLGIVLTEPRAAQVQSVAREAGFLVNAPTPERIRLAPALILTADQVAEFVAAWPRIWQEAGE